MQKNALKERLVFDLRFDVSVKNAVSVHVVDRLQDLVHVILDAPLGEVVPAALDCFIHVHVHELKDKCQAAGGLVTALSRQSKLVKPKSNEFSIDLVVT